MERVELLVHPGGRVAATAWVHVALGELRIYPTAAARPRWVGRARSVRFADGREAMLQVRERRTGAVRWLIGVER